MQQKLLHYTIIFRRYNASSYCFQLISLSDFSHLKQNIGAGVGIGLGHNILHMGAYRLRTDKKLLGYLLVGQTSADQFNNLNFPFGQRILLHGRLPFLGTAGCNEQHIIIGLQAITAIGL